MTPSESRQNLPLTAPTLILAIVLRKGFVTKVNDNKMFQWRHCSRFCRFWQYVSFQFDLTPIKLFASDSKSSAVGRKQFGERVCQILIKSMQNWLVQSNSPFSKLKPNLMILHGSAHDLCCACVIICIMQSGWGISSAFSSTDATCILQYYVEISGIILTAHCQIEPKLPLPDLSSKTIFQGVNYMYIHGFAQVIIWCL